jgi:hypothetical protein
MKQAGALVLVRSQGSNLQSYLETVWSKQAEHRVMLGPGRKRVLPMLECPLLIIC